MRKFEQGKRIGSETRIDRKGEREPGERKGWCLFLDAESETEKVSDSTLHISEFS